jgi:transmembrane sensor
MKKPGNLAELIAKYQAGTATPQELQLLNEWYHSFDDSEAEIVSQDPLNEETLSQNIHQRLTETIGAANTNRGKSKKIIWRIAAAFLLLFLGTASYSLFFATKEPAPPATIAVKPAPVTDIQPGGNKALLTLADNTTIVLDSAANGLISTQGSMKVEKLQNGLLSYTINGRQVTESDEAFYNTITTPRGGQYKVTLSDGTKVWLNAASSIRFPVAFTGNTRRVEVTGETYFEVAPNEKMPFVVKAPNEEIEVLGTHFNVNAYDDEPALRTTLLEGKVKISSATGSTQFLSPGQQSVLNKNGKINVVDNADTEEAVAWINGRFQFKSADLRTMLRQIGRWYDVDVEYRGDVDLHFTGQLTRNENVSRVFEKLELTGEVHFSIEGRKIIVTR